MSSKVVKWWLRGSIILLILACVSWLAAKLDTYRWTQRSITSAKQVTTSRNEYQKKLSKLRFRVAQNNANSKNPALKSLSLQNGSEELMDTVGTNFFKTYYTWKNVSQYKERQPKLKAFVSKDLLNDKGIFGSDQQAKGIEATGLTSKFDNAKFWIENVDDKSITAIGRVQFDSAYSDSPSGTGIRTYEITYDKGQQKITKLNLLQSSVEQ